MGRARLSINSSPKRWSLYWEVMEIFYFSLSCLCICVFALIFSTFTIIFFIYVQHTFSAGLKSDLQKWDGFIVNARGMISILVACSSSYSSTALSGAVSFPALHSLSYFALSGLSFHSSWNNCCISLFLSLCLFLCFSGPSFLSLPREEDNLMHLFLTESSNSVIAFSSLWPLSDWMWIWISTVHWAWNVLEEQTSHRHKDATFRKTQNLSSLLSNSCWTFPQQLV